MRTHGTPEELERWRRQAVAAVQNGEIQTDVARTLGVSDAAVSRWVKKVEAHGGNLDALAAKRHTGPKRLLSPEDELRLVGLLKQGATAHGFSQRTVDRRSGAGCHRAPLPARFPRRVRPHPAQDAPGLDQPATPDPSQEAR